MNIATTSVEFSINNILCTIRLAKKYSRPDHHLKHFLKHSATRRVKSRRPFARAASDLMDSIKQVETISSWIHRRWSQENTNSPHFLPTLLELSTSNTLPNLSRLAWVTLNRLQTHVGRFRKNLHKWGLSANFLCPCNSEKTKRPYT